MPNSLWWNHLSDHSLMQWRINRGVSQETSLSPKEGIKKNNNKKTSKNCRNKKSATKNLGISDPEGCCGASEQQQGGVVLPAVDGRERGALCRAQRARCRPTLRRRDDAVARAVERRVVRAARVRLSRRRGQSCPV